MSKYNGVALELLFSMVIAVFLTAKLHISNAITYMGEEFVVMWIEAAYDCLELYHHLPGGSEENRDKYQLVPGVRNKPLIQLFKITVSHFPSTCS
jgi:hypothetical protein